MVNSMAKILDSTNGDLCPLDLEMGKKTVISEKLCHNCAEAINAYTQPEGFAVLCAWTDRNKDKRKKVLGGGGE